MNNLNLSMFRAYDIRTPSENLTDELAARLARAEAVYFRDSLGVPGVLVARDARLTGPRYLQLAVEEYRRAGLSVVVALGVSSTSAFYFAAMRHPGLAGVLFGASHNPARDTGQKIVGPGVRPIARHLGPEGGLDRIQELYAAGVAASHRPGAITAYDPTEEYIAYSMKLAGVEPGSLGGLKLFHDYLSGAAGSEMMLAFGRAKAELTPLHFAADGSFPAGDPNPVKKAVIHEGFERLVHGDFLLGAFFDGDGDRIDFYFGDGRYLSSSFVYAGMLPAVLERFGGCGGSGPGAGVFADIKANPLAVLEMAKSGIKVSMIRNGHSQIKNAMLGDASICGAVEESAHYYEAFHLDGRRFCAENTLYVALLVSRLWHEAPGRFDALWELQARTAREREWGHKFKTDSDRAAALSAVEAHFTRSGAESRSRAPDGSDLEATILRSGVPFDLDAGTRLESSWFQICQRISQSEDGLARWEVVASSTEAAAEAKRAISSIVRPFGAGEEYQG